MKLRQASRARQLLRNAAIVIGIAAAGVCQAQPPNGAPPANGGLRPNPGLPPNFAKAVANPASPVVSPIAVIHTVPNLQRSVAFYRDVVGLTVVKQDAFPSGSSRSLRDLLGMARADVRTATLAIPGTSLKLVLLQFVGANTRVSPALQDPGNVRLVLNVKDISKKFAAIHRLSPTVYSSGGGPVYPEGPSTPMQAVVIADPDGFQLELVGARRNPASRANPSKSGIVNGFAELVIADADETLKFYRDVLGFSLLERRVLPSSTLELEGTPGATVTEMGMLAPRASFPWFLYDFQGISRTARQRQLQDIGSTGISLQVKNLASLLSTLKAQGIDVVSRDGNAVAIPGEKAVLVRDPSGVLIEFVQMQG